MRFIIKALLATTALSTAYEINPSPRSAPRGSARRGIGRAVQPRALATLGSNRAVLAGASVLALLLGMVPAAQAGGRITSGGGAGGGGVDAAGAVVLGGAGGIGGGGGGAGSSASAEPGHEGGAGGDGSSSGQNSGVGNGGTPGQGCAAGGYGRAWDGGGGGSTPLNSSQGPGTGGTGGAGGAGNYWPDGNYPWLNAWGDDGERGQSGSVSWGWGSGGGGGGAGIYRTGSLTLVGQYVLGGKGGEFGFGGGGGGVGVVLDGFGDDLNNEGSSIEGGAGGMGGYGGGGGAGVFLVSGSNLNNRSGSITGGAGGTAIQFTMDPGTGGAGGAGVLANGGWHFNEAIIAGGEGGFGAFGGGAGGAGFRVYGDPDGYPQVYIANLEGGRITGGNGGGADYGRLPGAGAGGDGLVLDNNPGDAWIVNVDLIAGGNGGTYSGSVGVANPWHGVGGVGVRVTADGVIVSNSGTISGGLGGDGTTRANAVELNGNNNTLYIYSSSIFDGNVVAQGSGNSLGLGGWDSAVFDLSRIGPSAAFQGFERFQKNDGGTWTLNGIGTQGWTVGGGTLRAGNAGAFGAGHNYTVNGGMLDLSGYDLTMSALSGSGGTVDMGTADLTIEQNTNTSYRGVLTGSGLLTKSGNGVLTMTGNNSYQGGTLQVAADTNLGASSGGLTFNGGTLAATASFVSGRAVTLNGSGGFDAASGTTFGLSGVVTGAGTLTKRGAGTLTLTGISNYTGGTMIRAGRLAVDGGGISHAGTDLTVGSQGGDDAALTIENGGTVRNDWGFVGYDAGSAGSVTVTGTDASGNASAWRNAGAVVVGLEGRGELIVSDGGTVSNTVGRVGYFEGSNGTALVTGTGSSWANSGDLYIGNAGSGELTIADAGYVSANAVSLTALGAATAGLRLESGGVLQTGQVSRSFGGTVAFDGGILRLTGDQSNLFAGFAAGGVTMNTGGAIIDTQGFAVATAAGLQGTGGLTKTGSGTLTLTGNNAYSGGTVVEQGTLAGSAVSLRGDIVNDGAVVFADIGSNGYVGVISGTGSLTVAGAGALTLTGANTHTGGTTVTTGKTLSVASDKNLGGAAGRLTLDGATLQTTADIAATRNITLGGSGAFLTDTDTTLMLSGAIDGTGAMVKDGAGILRVTGVSSYDGATEVRNGTLQVDAGGTIASSSLLTVRQDGRLAGSGTVGTTVVADGGHIAPGSSIGTLTVDGDLTLSAGSFLDYEIGAPGVTAAGGRSDRIVVTGDLTLDGALNLIQSGNPSDGAAGFGYYRLITYDGALTGTGLTLGATAALPLPGAYRVDAGDGRVDLFAAAFGDDTLQHWQGGDGTWGAARTDWLNLDGGVPFAWAGNHAVFRDAGGFIGGIVAVEGMQGFKGLQFVDEGYRLEGIGQLVIDGSDRADGNAEIRVLADLAEIATEITGTGGIAKTEAGRLVLSGANTYQGGTAILGGTVEVSADANLGATAAGLTLDGGVLATTASFDSARAVTLASDGGVDVAASTTLGLSGPVTGTGTLVKKGAGTLMLAGANAYGNTRVETGTLVGNAASISGDIANAGTVVFDQAGNGRFAGDIAGISGVRGAMVKDGAGELVLAGTSTLDWTINAGALVSSASRFGGDAAIGTGARFTLNDAANATYAGVISGAGDFVKAGGGNLRLTGDSSAFEGLTTVSGGRLSVGVGGVGSLGGSLAILNGGVIGGSGTIGTTAIGAGGIIAPGNSIGTLTVAGDLTLGQGSIYSTEIAGNGSSDRIAVTGTATIAGSEVSVAALDARTSYRNGQTYTILTAGNGISGAFEGAITQSAFLELALDHKAKAVDLTIKVKNANPEEPEELGEPEEPGTPPVFGTVAQTRNQIATAGALDTLQQSGKPIALYNALLMLNAGQARSAFDGLSGEIHASAKTALIEDSRFVRDAATSRVRAAFDGVEASGLPVMAYGQDGLELAPAVTDRFAVWGQAFGSWGHTGGDGNAAKLDRSTGGFLAGGDGAVGDAWRVGLLAGYSHSSFDADGRASSGTSDNYHLGLYGGGQWGGLGLRGGVAYSWHDIGTERTVAFTGFADQLKGDYRAGTFQVFGEAGYRFDTPDISFEPFANLAHVSLKTDGFGEKGGAAALTSQSRTSDTTFTTLGLRASSDLKLGTLDASIAGTVGWRHAFGATTPTITQAFTGSEAFTVAGAPIARNAAVVEAGLDLKLAPQAELGISYDGQFSSRTQQHGFTERLGVRF